MYSRLVLRRWNIFLLPLAWRLHGVSSFETKRPSRGLYPGSAPRENRNMRVSSHCAGVITSNRLEDQVLPTSLIGGESYIMAQILHMLLFRNGHPSNQPSCVITTSSA
ncbi:hypothetical protein GGR53DRAFT_500494 [Hypoxylon sp. FL1150]|nr:hypothetical protein GGR53DRAFT_500494 [Hypoxylon sp. FL1150]